MHFKPHELVRRDIEAALKSAISSLSRLKGEVLVVTGGTGFVGTWIAESVAYLNDQHAFGTQLALVSRSTDLFRATRPHLANRKDISLIKSDVRHLLELPKEAGWIIHAAGNPDTRFHSTSPIETMSVIADGTHSVLRAAERCDHLKMLLNMSSALVYGAQPMELEHLSENFNGSVPLGAVSAAYPEAKRYAETLCAAARSQGRIPTLNVRPFAFIGPYQGLDTPWALNSFIRDALHGHPIRVLGDGQTVRSYLYGSDMAGFLLSLLVSGTEGAAYNLGSPEAIHLEGLAQKIASQFNPRPEIRLLSSPGAGRSRMLPDLSNTERASGFKQTVSLDQAIAKTIEWHQAGSKP
jgi:nucleoside-diphosphate-sugar epimerase